MLKEIREYLEKGPTTVDMLAKKLHVSRGSIEDALRLMIDMGLIEEVVPETCPSKGKFTCSFCPLKDKCSVVQYRSYKLKEKTNKEV